jgi:histidyl-tRNA synthetase
VPSAVLVALASEEARADAVAVAEALRAHGIATEVAPRASDKLGKQIRHAERRGIPYVWFGSLAGEVKDIRSGEQLPADARRWQPPEADLRPQVQRADG